MADTAVHSTVLTAGTTTADPVGTTIVQANNQVVDCTAYPPEETVLRIKQTDASARIATIAAGSNPPADAAGQGALTKSMAQNEVWWVGPLSSSRYLKANGTVVVTFAASFAGTIEAFRVPRNT